MLSKVELGSIINGEKPECWRMLVEINELVTEVLK
jgi:hypothetical protein